MTNLIERLSNAFTSALAELDVERYAAKRRADTNTMSLFDDEGNSAIGKKEWKEEDHPRAEKGSEHTPGGRFVKKEEATGNSSESPNSSDGHAPDDKHHVAIYNGKRVVMDYVGPGEQFQFAAQRIADNGAEGVVVAPDGNRWEVTQGSRKAKLISKADHGTIEQKYPVKEKGNSPEKVDSSQPPKFEPQFLGKPAGDDAESLLEKRKALNARFGELADEVQPMNERAYQIEQAIKEARQKKVGANYEQWKKANREMLGLERQLKNLDVKRKPLQAEADRVRLEADQAHQAYLKATKGDKPEAAAKEFNADEIVKAARASGKNVWQQSKEMGFGGIAELSSEQRKAIGDSMINNPSEQSPKPPSEARAAAMAKFEERNKPAPSPGLIMPETTVDNSQAKAGDQLGLFGEATKAKVADKPFVPTLLGKGEQSKGWQGSMFETMGHPDQMNLFSDGSEPEGMVHKPKEEAKSYEDFKKEYSDAFNQSMKYKPSEIGSREFTQKMADLADKHPEHLERLEAEQDAQAGFKPTLLDQKKSSDVTPKDEGPKDGDRDENGLVFRGGRWHREDEAKPAERPATYGDMFSSPDGRVGYLGASGGMGSERVKLKHQDGSEAWHNRKDLKPVAKIKKQWELETPEGEKASESLKDVASQTKKLKDDNAELLMKKQLRDRFEMGLKSGEMTQEQFDKAKANGTIASDTEYAKAAEVGDKIEAVKSSLFTGNESSRQFPGKLQEDKSKLEHDAIIKELDEIGAKGAARRQKNIDHQIAGLRPSDVDWLDEAEAKRHHELQGKLRNNEHFKDQNDPAKAKERVKAKRAARLAEQSQTDKFASQFDNPFVERYRAISQQVLREYAQGHRAPTEAQKEAGNYKKAHIVLHGLNIAIETPKGVSRRPEWPPMAAHYGDLKRTLGKDGDPVDVFVGPHLKSEIVFVVDQPTLAGRFDEHKVLLGFNTQKQATDAYLKSYKPGWKLGKVTSMMIGQFKQWLEHGDTTKPINSQVSKYSEVEFDRYSDDDDLRYDMTSEDHFDAMKYSIMRSLGIEVDRYQYTQGAWVADRKQGAFDESKVNRHGKGSEKGGQFAPKGGGSAPVNRQGFARQSAQAIEGIGDFFASQAKPPQQAVAPKPAAQAPAIAKPAPVVKQPTPAISKPAPVAAKPSRPQLVFGPRVEPGHHLHASNLPRDIHASYRTVLQNMHEALGNDWRHAKTDAEYKDAFSKVDKNRLQGVLQQMNALDKSARAKGVPLSDFVNAENGIPPQLAMRLSGGSRFFDRNKIAHKMNQAPKGFKPAVTQEQSAAAEADERLKKLSPDQWQKKRDGYDYQDLNNETVSGPKGAYGKQASEPPKAQTQPQAESTSNPTPDASQQPKPPQSFRSLKRNFFAGNKQASMEFENQLHQALYDLGAGRPRDLQNPTKAKDREAAIASLMEQTGLSRAEVVDQAYEVNKFAKEQMKDVGDGEHRKLAITRPEVAPEPKHDIANISAIASGKLDREIKALIGSDNPGMIADFRKQVEESHRQLTEEAKQHNEVIRRLAGAKEITVTGKDGNQHKRGNANLGAAVNWAKNTTGDYATKSGWDMVVDSINREYPHMLQGHDKENAAMELLAQGVKEVPNIYDQEVMDHAMSSLPPQFFSYYDQGDSDGDSFDEMGDDPFGESQPVSEMENVPFSWIKAKIQIDRYRHQAWIERYANERQMSFNWDESAHPRHEKGAEEGKGGQFAPKDASIGSKETTGKQQGFEWAEGHKPVSGAKATGPVKEIKAVKDAADEGNLKIRGVSKEVAKCDRCGRSHLGKTIKIEVCDNDGKSTGDFYHFGSDCVGTVMEMAPDLVMRKAIEADYKKAMEEYRNEKKERDNSTSLLAG
jgi:hypothetical protein